MENFALAELIHSATSSAQNVTSILDAALKDVNADGKITIPVAVLKSFKELMTDQSKLVVMLYELQAKQADMIDRLMPPT